MLQIMVPECPEQWDEVKEEFIPGKEQKLQLEHSLISISKWESKWHKSFIHSQNKTDEEVLDYVKCMTLNPNVDSDIYNKLTPENIQQINAYINDPMTATTVYEEKGRGRKEIVTSELIYCWMVELGIPPEYQKWHINRLITLIKVCSIRKNPPKKMSRRELISRNAALNAARKKQLNTKG